MNRNSLRETAARTYHTIARATINKSNDDPQVQELHADFFNSDTREKIERLQNYGFTSMPLPRDEQKQQGGGNAQNGEQPKGPAAEAVAVFLGGQRNHPVIISVDDRRHRPRALKPGENAQYDDQGQAMLLKRDGVYVVGTKEVVSLRHVDGKEKQPAGDKGKDFKHEGEDGKVTAEIKITNGRIQFIVGGTVLGEVTSQGFVIGGSFADNPKKVHRKGDLDSLGDAAEESAMKGWGV